MFGLFKKKRSGADLSEIRELLFGDAPLIVWDASDAAIGRSIEDLLRAGQRVADAIGPWEEPRRGPPPRDHLRLNMLTASGLHFGEGPLSLLEGDPMAGPVLAAGTALMQQLIQHAEGSAA